MSTNQRLHWAWVILGVCFVNLFINYSIRLGYGVVLPEMIRDLKLGRAAGGTIYNAYLLTYILVTPFTGFLTDRLGARRVITVCCLFLCLGIGLMGTADSLLTASIYYAIAGLGATGMWTPVITLVQRWFAFHRRGLALGILSTGYGLGFASMGALFPLIVLHLNWRYTWYLLGLLAGIMIVVNLLLLKSDPAGAGYRPWGEAEKEKTDVLGQPPPGEANRLADIFKNRNFWLLGFSYFAIAYALYGATTFMVDYAEYQLNFSLEKSSFLATIHGLSQLAGVLIILPLSDIWGRKKTILISNLMIVLALTGLLFTSSSWVMLCLAVGGMAVFYGATFPIYGACAGDYFPREHMGTVIGAWTPFYGAGAIATHWISGLLRDRTGVYDHAFFINITMAAVALILIAAVSEQKKPIIWKKFPSC